MQLFIFTTNYCFSSKKIDFDFRCGEINSVNTIITAIEVIIVFM